MLRDLLLVLNILICLALIGVVLLQRSEGGALGTGNPTGLVTARGAGDLLTRTTWVLFTLFLSISLALTLIGGRERSSQAILERLKHATVNPALLDRPIPPPATTPGQAPGGAIPPTPAQSAAAPLTLPPIGAPAATPKPRPAHAATRTPARQAAPPIINVPPPAPKLAAPAPLTLPPLTTPGSPPAKPPAP
ncbi:MAG TPA: preprotein translocase subunit SecG [Caulobacteraceae bacterium]|nr:preprotein translocase subunit SecG [Caulobacteraceae bacterium]